MPLQPNKHRDKACPRVGGCLLQQGFDYCCCQDGDCDRIGELDGYAFASQLDQLINGKLRDHPITPETALHWLNFARTIGTSCKIIYNEAYKIEKQDALVKLRQPFSFIMSDIGAPPPPPPADKDK